MFNLIQGSKYVAETISLIISFADLMSSGDTISGTPVISVDVATGTDPNPSNILYSTTSVTHGTTVEQRFRLGIPGVIYHIVYSIQTVAGDTFEKETYLAILPDEDNAVPNWLPLWKLTQLYPYVYGPEYLQGRTTASSGSLRQTSIPYSEFIQGRMFPTSGTLNSVSTITYSYTELMQGRTYPTTGTLTFLNTVTYSYTESIKGAIFPVTGSLNASGLFYNMAPEYIQGKIVPSTGTLV